MPPAWRRPPQEVIQVILMDSFQLTVRRKGMSINVLIGRPEQGSAPLFIDTALIWRFNSLLITLLKAKIWCMASNLFISNFHACYNCYTFYFLLVAQMIIKLPRIFESSSFSKIIRSCTWKKRNFTLNPCHDREKHFNSVITFGERNTTQTSAVTTKPKKIRKTNRYPCCLRRLIKLDWADVGISE